MESPAIGLDVGVDSTSVDNVTSADAAIDDRPASTDNPAIAESSGVADSSGSADGSAIPDSSALADDAAPSPRSAATPDRSAPINMARRGFFRRFAKMAAPAGLLATACEMTADSFEPEFHLLQRASYGVTNAELERIRNMGAGAWLEEQLNPGSIDTSQIDALVGQFPALSMTPPQLFTNYRGGGPSQAALFQLQFASVIRQAQSPAQLYERMVEFWSDHFNIDGGGSQTLRLLKIVEDREAIRPNAMGTFANILKASATSPAMLVYLDNVTSSAGAINENYAREFLELHTVGVGGGYTEDDIVSLARLITGWRINNQTGEFQVRNSLHDSGDVTIMGWVRPTSGRGPRDGLEFADWLAVQPQTAEFVCRKIAVRFAGDNPDPGLVSAMRTAWLDNGSAIVPVLRTMFTHSEFQATADTKFNRPADQLAATARRLGGTWTPSTNPGDLSDLAQLFVGLGQVPFGWPAPNGYPDVEGAWLNTGSLIGRWNLTGELLDGTANVFGYDAGPFRAGLNGMTAVDICDELIQRVLHRPSSGPGRAALLVIAGWNQNDRPNGVQISLKLNKLVFALLVAPDAQYR